MWLYTPNAFLLVFSVSPDDKSLSIVSELSRMMISLSFTSHRLIFDARTPSSFTVGVLCFLFRFSDESVFALTKTTSVVSFDGGSLPPNVLNGRRACTNFLPLAGVFDPVDAGISFIFGDDFIAIMFCTNRRKKCVEFLKPNEHNTKYQSTRFHFDCTKRLGNCSHCVYSCCCCRCLYRIFF